MQEVVLPHPVGSALFIVQTPFVRDRYIDPLCQSFQNWQFGNHFSEEVQDEKCCPVLVAQLFIV